MEERLKVWLVRPKGRKYQIRWEDPDTGKVRTKSTKTTRKREAERMAGKIEADIVAGKMANTARIRWQDFKERYEKQFLVDQADNTCNLIYTVWSKLDATFPSLERLRDSDQRKLAHFQESLRAEGLSIETIKTYLRHIRSFLGWAVRQKYLATVPHIEMPKKAKGRKAKGRAIFTEEFERMLSATLLVTTDVGRRRRNAKLTEEEKRPTDQELLIADSWKHLLRGLWLSGLRLGEAVELSWEPDTPISVHVGGKYPALRILSEGQKSGREEPLPLVPEFCDFLESIPEVNRHGRVFRPMARNGSDAPMGDAWIGKVISRIGEAARVKVAEGKRKGEPHIKYASAHDMRRSFATRWVPKVMPATLQKLMRHKSIQTTLDYYAEVQSEAVGDELRRLEVPAKTKSNIFGNSGPFEAKGSKEESRENPSFHGSF
jgi:integrase